MAQRENSLMIELLRRPKRPPFILSGPWWILIAVTLALFVFLFMRENNTWVAPTPFLTVSSNSNCLRATSRTSALALTVIRGELKDYKQLPEDYKKVAVMVTILSRR